MSFPTANDASRTYVGEIRPGDDDRAVKLERPIDTNLQKWHSSINQQKLQDSETQKKSALNIRDTVRQDKSSVRGKLDNLRSASLFMDETRKKGGRRNRRKKKNAKSQKKKAKKRKSRSRKH